MSLASDNETSPGRSQSTPCPPDHMEDVMLAVSSGEEIDEEFVSFASRVGATHIGLGGLPFRYDAFLPDNSRPYPNWSQNSLSLFRICPPPALGEFMPDEVIARNQKVLDQRIELLRQQGLKAVFNASEPLYLPEPVFREHPNWRGGQCELGRIATTAYFTPSIDDPEVLELYEEAARLLCERYPEIERFFFWTNDCGAGLQWSTYQYPGVNGPTKYRHRGPGERIAGWLQAIRRGASEAGSDVDINLSTFTFPPAEMEAIRAKFGENLYLKGVNGKGDRFWTAGAGPGASFHGFLLDLPDPFSYVRGLQKVYGEDGGARRKLSIGGHSSCVLLKTFLEEPGTGVVHETEVVRRAAAQMVGDDHADALVGVWRAVTQARHAMNQVRQRGGVSPLTGEVLARWLVRPLVPRPEALTDEETAPFRDYIFSKAPDKDIDDLCVVLGKPVFIGSCAVWMARWALQEAVDTLRSAQRKAKGVAAELSEPRPIDLLTARIGAFACVLEDARLAIMFQHALNTADQPRYGRNVWDFDDNIYYDQRALTMRRIARESLDNTSELIRLIENHDEPVLGVASSAQTESVFQFGPDLAQQLRHKREVMLDHWPEYEVLYPTSRKNEYEPYVLRKSSREMDDGSAEEEREGD
ncbi:MAG: hypothetical protein ACLFWL_09760 [Candidatus Brocadiia bacterium]